MYKVPILLLIFNRPDNTARVLAEIKKIKPSRLFIAADGPRADRPGELEKCLATRKIVEDGIDWDCEVQKNYSDKNEGLGVGLYKKISWFFDNVEEGIVLEDDCIAHQSFFGYCEVLLEKYRNEAKVMMISGDNFQNGVKRGAASYYFSRYNHAWGWASWKRAWQTIEFQENNFLAYVDKNVLANIWPEKIVQKYWLDKYKNPCWDHQWTYAIWRQNGIACLPNVNLISNIGFGSESSHTFFKHKSMMSIPTQAIHFPLIHPTLLVADVNADKYENKHVFKIVLWRIWLLKFFKKTGIFKLIKFLYLKFLAK